MVHAGRLEAGSNYVAVLARSRGRNMTPLRHCLGLHGNVPTTVTTCAAAGDPGMDRARIRRRKRSEIGVTGVAVSRSGDMRTWLRKALIRRAIMAAIT